MKIFLMVLAVLDLADAGFAAEPVYTSTTEHLVCHYQFNTRQPGPLVDRELKLEVAEGGRATISIRTQGGSDSLTVDRVHRDGVSFSAAAPVREGFARSIQFYDRTIILQVRDQKTGDVRTVACLGDVLGAFYTMMDAMEQASH